MDFLIWLFVDVICWYVGALGLKVVSLGKLKISNIEPNWVAGFGAISILAIVALTAYLLRS